MGKIVLWYGSYPAPKLRARRCITDVKRNYLKFDDFIGFFFFSYSPYVTKLVRFYPSLKKYQQYIYIYHSVPSVNATNFKVYRGADHLRSPTLSI